MTVNITIIGLGQIGASIGMALGERKLDIKRIGHDKQPDLAREAQKKGAVDELKFNLPASVVDADLVLLCLPVDQIRDTLRFIAQDLREGAVVVDTAPVKSALAGWANDALLPGCYYVGITPSLNFDYLHETQIGLAAARPDLFRDAVILVDAPSGTPEEAVRLVSDFISLLDAVSLFASAAEIDGLMAAMHLLPKLTSAALLNATVDQPGWSEARKMGGRPYAAVTGLLSSEEEIPSLREAALLNRDNMLRTLDAMQDSLGQLRERIAEGDAQGLQALLEAAQQGQVRWWDDRTSANWLTKELGRTEGVPGFGQRLKQSFMGDRKDKFRP